MKHVFRVGILLFCVCSVWYETGSTARAGEQHSLSGRTLPASSYPEKQLLPIHVLVQSPADTVTELQIICLFRSEPRNTLHGSLIELNTKLHGLLDNVRKPSVFGGEWGETYLITPPDGTIQARKLLLIGLGDSQTFEPERMKLVGSIAYQEASHLGVAHPFFAPTILDGGVTTFSTGQVSEQVTLGFLHAALDAHHESTIQDVTYLAGASHVQSTQSGIDKATDTIRGECGAFLKCA